MDNDREKRPIEDPLTQEIADRFETTISLLGEINIFARNQCLINGDATIRADSNLENYGFDSLRTSELLMHIAEKFEIEIDEFGFSGVPTAKNLIRYVLESNPQFSLKN